MQLKKIISGGQTGVDMGALDFALEKGIDCGGWCPKGRICETGVIPEKYPVKETDSRDYPRRTEKNILDSDGTLILTGNNITDNGTILTIKLCKKYKKPHLFIEMTEDIDSVKADFEKWFKGNNIKVLNVAGCRESRCPGIQVKTKDILKLIILA